MENNNQNIMNKNHHHNYPLAAILCGFERGGTTLVSEILRQHPLLDSGFECGFLLGKELNEFPSIQPYCNMLKTGWRVNDSDLNNYICKSTTWLEGYSRLLEKSKIIPNKNTWIFDKTPKYMKFLPDILEKVPGIPCVVIVRDPRALLWSWVKRSPWKDKLDQWQEKNLKANCDRYLSYGRGWREAIEKGFGSQILLVQHERLCCCPVEESKKIFDFIGFDFDPAYLSFLDKRYSNVHESQISEKYITEYRQHFSEKICHQILMHTAEFKDWFWTGDSHSVVDDNKDDDNQKVEVSKFMRSHVNWNNLERKGIVRGWILPDQGGCDPSDIVVLINGQKLTSEQIKPKRFQRNSDNLRVNFCFDLSPYNLQNGDQIQLALKDTGEILGTSKSGSRESQKSVTYVNFDQNLSPHEIRQIWLRHQPKPLYNKSLNLTLIFCAKSACSFGVKWFFYHAGLYQEVESYRRFPHKYRTEIFMPNPEYQKHIREVDRILNSNIVCLVRDPFSRAVSSYIHAIKTGYDNDGISKFLGRKIGRKNSFCFDEFVQYLKSLDIRNCNIHHQMQAHPLMEMGIIKPHIIKVENLFNDFQEVEKKLGLNPAPLSEISKSLEFHRTPKDSEFKKECYHIQFPPSRKQLFPHYKYFYSEELVRDVANIYRADFEIFGYKPELDLELTVQAPSQPSFAQIEKDLLKWRENLNEIRG
ncbi:MAG: sulfotransferase [Limnospira sp. PMC 894.15]|uniref:sulfotransferase n=1 Tax=Limnospira sp. PMC 894.15 TaxID=2981100 RepID=UPI0028E0BBB0|nr:sulfotransferase [Limnospira sp. PMC 894.15]MDT9188906.1 sulfotransferase [Limnospira sp. PMC 894.15]